MEFHIHHHVVADPDTRAFLQRMERKMSEISDAVAVLVTDVAAEKTLIGSLTMYVKGVPQLIQAAVDKAVAAGADPTTLTSIRDLITSVEGSTAEMVSAIPANTPAATP